MQITFAQKEDIDEILRLQTQIYRTKKIAPNSKKLLGEQLKNPTCDVLVAKKNEKIVATASIYYIDVAVRGRPYAYLEGLVVDRSFRNQGIGSAIFEKLISLARQKNCYKIIFTSSYKRKVAHKLYLKLGFQKWGLEFRMDL